MSPLLQTSLPLAMKGDCQFSLSPLRFPSASSNKVMRWYDDVVTRRIAGNVRLFVHEVTELRWPSIDAVYSCFWNIIREVTYDVCEYSKENEAYRKHSLDLEACIYTNGLILNLFYYFIKKNCLSQQNMVRRLYKMSR